MKSFTYLKSNTNKTKIKSLLFIFLIVSIIPLAIASWFTDWKFFGYDGVSEMLNLSPIPAVLFLRTYYVKELWFKEFVDSIISLKDLTVGELFKKVIELISGGILLLLFIGLIAACVLPALAIVIVFFRWLF